MEHENREGERALSRAYARCGRIRKESWSLCQRGVRTNRDESKGTHPFCMPNGGSYFKEKAMPDQPRISTFLICLVSSKVAFVQPRQFTTSSAGWGFVTSVGACLLTRPCRNNSRRLLLAVVIDVENGGLGENQHVGSASRLGGISLSRIANKLSGFAWRRNGIVSLRQSRADELATIVA